MKTFLLLTLALLISACGKESGTKETSLEFKSEVSELTNLSINELEEVEDHLRNGRVFQRNTTQERNEIQQSLRLMKVGLLKISRNPRSLEALRLLNYYSKIFMGVKLTETDDGLLESFKYSINNTIARIARLNNLTLDQTPWILFKSNFSSGLDQFVTVSTKGDWQPGWALDRSFIRVRGEGNKSWLIAPPMNLEGTRQLKLRLHQTLSIDRATRFDDPFDRSQIINNAFKVMVSEDYVNGDPEAAKWKEHKISGFPIGSDFHAQWSDAIDLSEYENKTISIALLYNMDSRSLGRHFVTWQVNEFQVLGTGDTFRTQPRIRLEKMYEHLFNQPKLLPYHSVNTLDVVDWIPFGFSGKISFVKIESDSSNVDSWMISPKIRLDATETPTLILKEVVRTPKKANFKVLISESYNGEDPKLTNWIELEHFPANLAAEDNVWTTFTSKEIDLSSYMGKTFNLAFRYIGDDKIFRGWELESILIKGKGSSVVTNQTITYKNPNTAPEVPVENLKELVFFEQKDSWTTRVIEGTPASFNPVERNGLKYLEVSGFTGKNTGTVQLETSLIDIPTKNPVLQLNHSIRFYDPKDRGLNLIEVLASADNGQTWNKITFTKLPGANDRTAMDTEWYDMKAYSGKSIKLAFKYKTDAALNIFPSWQLYVLRTGELAE